MSEGYCPIILLKMNNMVIFSINHPQNINYYNLHIQTNKMKLLQTAICEQ